MHLERHASYNVRTTPQNARSVIQIVPTVPIGVSIGGSRIQAEKLANRCDQHVSLAKITSGMLHICFPGLPQLFFDLKGRVTSTLHKSASRYITPRGIGRENGSNSGEYRKTNYELG